MIKWLLIIVLGLSLGYFWAAISDELLPPPKGVMDPTWGVIHELV